MFILWKQYYHQTLRHTCSVSTVQIKQIIQSLALCCTKRWTVSIFWTVNGENPLQLFSRNMPYCFSVALSLVFSQSFGSIHLYSVTNLIYENQAGFRNKFWTVWKSLKAICEEYAILLLFCTFFFRNRLAYPLSSYMPVGTFPKRIFSTISPKVNLGRCEYCLSASSFNECHIAFSFALN